MGSREVTLEVMWGHVSGWQSEGNTQTDYLTHLPTSGPAVGSRSTMEHLQGPDDYDDDDDGDDGVLVSLYSSFTHT